MMILLESPASARTILTAETEAAQRQMVVKLAHQEAGKEMTDYEHFSGQYTYDTEIVRALLENGALTDDLDGFREDIIDLIDALVQMTWEKSVYVDPILKRYVDNDKPVDSTERSRLSRAIESLTQHMNRNHQNRTRNREDGPGSRSAVSNASAAYQLGTLDR
jgi:hypothetical protein